MEFTRREMLLIVTALGTKITRINGKTKWLKKKRMPTLRHKLADNITIGDKEEAECLKGVLDINKKKISEREKLTNEYESLMNRIKEEYNIYGESVSRQ